MRQLFAIALLASMLAIFVAGRSRSSARSSSSEAPVLAEHVRSAVRYTSDTRYDPPVRLHVVQVDLTSPNVCLSAVTAGPASDADRAAGWATTLQTVSTIARREGFDVAINGDFFSHDLGELGQLSHYRTGAPARTMGPLVSNGQVIAGTTSLSSYPALLVDERGRCSIATFTAVPAGARQFICGNDELVRRGKAIVHAVATSPADRTPITAVGLDRAGHTLTMLVVDGRREDYSVGMTPAEAADELVRLGCWSAINLDGGGSSTLVFRDARDNSYRVANCPSDGHQLSDSLSLERPVASALGIRLISPPAQTVAAH